MIGWVVCYDLDWICLFIHTHTSLLALGFNSGYYLPSTFLIALYHFFSRSTPSFFRPTNHPLHCERDPRCLGFNFGFCSYIFALEELQQARVATLLCENRLHGC